ncbi:tRNA pseudouridine synthase A [Alkalihalobacillus alcalophilus ATCC 27647 = CGMCC 1.3604]|uniref:tRNA pseudouridine synthase A n=1 Tax=Alkalihalobacillus alcalophilus ATCC 27647 = CGMCC 1.3604 TaxID=1218173 RepID=A0A094WG70_ALKAL|nr:tRNA pseudouridine(38-40) synthase TruA [Alkalihalobacillus alcalophilus]KGA95766.1 tRNA pseudouridine synthase A [Alkalihalobacillus alcalophilus ATCC 27647 = CGMCC 1.3604]MED1560612.1 tRNA pseudouridine(38-40) synthase TruA [Alkalihalobacillus alcalophilus]THG88394.1 tRNA pseudouridine synthase A [Alkalihalobacillus alcalophilus ATCC 27647 = CGMCC 1.3604]
MNNYKLTIQYDGGRYKGWQRLGNGENTIQAKIEHVVSEMAGVPIEIIGSGRTDAGVHALAQIANFKMEKEMTEQAVQTYLNKYLPQDIVVTNVEIVADRYHARFHTTEKMYLYKIWNEAYTNPFIRKYSTHIEEPLDLEKMKMAASFFIGEHDFTAFSNAKSNKKTKVREIYSFEITKENGLIEVRISGNGFLYNMVRKIVGTLIEVGLGRIEAEDIPAIIEKKERNQTGRMAEAAGLFLV